MGSWLSRLKQLYDSFGDQSRHARILMLGLDGAGKTTLLYKLKLVNKVNTIPTIGFNVETIQVTNSVSFTVWDVGGGDKIRALWRHYYKGCTGLVFVVDSIDKERFSEAHEELSGILKNEEMAGISGVPVVVFANKQDLPNACSPSEVAARLGLPQLQYRKWLVHG